MLEKFEDLDLDDETNWAGIKRSYLEQLKVWHPDRFGNDEALRKKGEEKTKKLTSAFNKLKQHIGNLEKSGVHIVLDQPILPQLAQAGVIKFSQNKQEQEEDTKKDFNQEPLVGDRIKKAEFDKEYPDFEESIWHPQVIAASVISTIALLFALYFGYKNFFETKVVYGPPADLSKFAQKKEEDPFLKELQDSIGFEKIRSGDGIVEGQLEGARIIAGVTKHSKNEIPDIIKYASRCDVKNVKNLLDRGASVDKEDPDGLTSLSWAAKTNCEQLARLLVSRGANTNHISKNGFTPLSWARWYKNIEVIKVLEIDKRNLVKR